MSVFSHLRRKVLKCISEEIVSKLSMNVYKHVHAQLQSVSEQNVRARGAKRMGRCTSSRMVLKDIEWRRVDWMHLAQDIHQWLDLVNTVMNLWV
jgi:hypothetical protein